MPTLDWIGKKAVVGHHREVPFQLFKSNEELSVGEPGSGNLLVQGDNLVALQALLPYHAGKMKWINWLDRSFAYPDLPAEEIGFFLTHLVT
jgi:site-specific DNA-methyltransferase (adenine-specific)/adenine-specific DNA-methyltransferase